MTSKLVLYLAASATLAGCLSTDELSRTDREIARDEASADAAIAVQIRYDGGLLCSGVQLSEHWVLTAGHCMTETGIGDSPEIQIVATVGSSSRVVYSGVADAIYHPGTSGLLEDIGLFRLRGFTPAMRDSSRHARLAINPPQSGSVEVSGWSRGYDECYDASPALGMGAFELAEHQLGWPYQMIVDQPDDGETTPLICEGDSGGPWVISAGGDRLVAAVTSTVNPYNDTAEGALVGGVLSWIETVTADLDPNLRLVCSSGGTSAGVDWVQCQETPPGDLVYASHITFDQTTGVSSGLIRNGDWWELVFTPQTRVHPTTGEDMIVIPAGRCDPSRLVNGECLVSRMSLDQVVVTMSCHDIGDVGGPRAYDPAPVTYRVGDEECENRAAVPDPGFMAFGDSCLHPSLLSHNGPSTYTYFHGDAEGGKPPQLTNEHSFACRWPVSDPPPTVLDPQVVLYVQAWEPGTMSGYRGGVAHAYVDVAGVDWGQVLTGEQRTQTFGLHNIGTGAIELDPAGGIALTDPTRTDLVVTSQQLAATTAALDWSRHFLHLDPAANSIGPGGILEFQAMLTAGVAGDTTTFEIAVDAIEPIAERAVYPIRVYASYTPVDVYTPEISLDNWGTWFWSPLHAGERLAVRITNRGGEVLEIHSMALESDDGDLLAIDHAVSGGIQTGPDDPFVVAPYDTARIVLRPENVTLPPVAIEQYLVELVLETNSIDVDAPSAGFPEMSAGGQSRLQIDLALVP